MNAITRFFSQLFGALGAHRPAPQGQVLSITELKEQQVSWLVVGLGNPGEQYAATRHNVGYMAIDDLLAANGDTLQPVAGAKSQGAVVCVEDQKVLALRSTTFMNLSGEGVGPLAKSLGVAPERVIVIHDELDLPAHKVRIKQGGNENGHNGLKSITEHLGTREYPRVRIGISRPPKETPIPDYVLGPVDSSAGFDQAIALAAAAARAIVSQGISRAQNDIHSRSK
ncbi:peptidyl-tRNA hydrolase [Corynebacterium phocae]|uniref:Peptidyl-tRNA hydrolase n=1 Tax=Corynebacterium phocae TaxID=161895 RepID=A0A1L7D464_9CORY|nr:aminoacyl-tRNA hydrolase [Corynebacterium phocae]APT92939.1 peptidyl-tRNA hydrolase [Corynebacterium phocae]KAA8723272.1 aminoacyl-tRNA hydrolase [Corynebacterium phocae]